MNDELDITELLDYREILEAYAKVPANKRKECKDKMIAIAETLANTKKWS